MPDFFPAILVGLYHDYESGIWRIATIEQIEEADRRQDSWNLSYSPGWNVQETIDILQLAENGYDWKLTDKFAEVGKVVFCFHNFLGIYLHEFTSTGYRVHCLILVPSLVDEMFLSDIVSSSNPGVKG